MDALTQAEVFALIGELNGFIEKWDPPARHAGKRISGKKNENHRRKQCGKDAPGKGLQTGM